MKLINRSQIGAFMSNNIVEIVMHTPGDIEAVKKAIADADDINMVNGDGNTALHMAAGNGLTLIVTLLLAHPKIDKSIKNHEGFLPLDFAKMYKHNDIITLLEKE